MKKITILTVFALLSTFAQSANNITDSSKAAFYSALDTLQNMLEGKDSLNYEKAVFITENAYYDNKLSYERFQKSLDFHSNIIKELYYSKQVKQFQDNIKKGKYPKFCKGCFSCHVNG